MNQAALPLADVVCRESVLSALTHHVGRERGITARALVVEIAGEHTPARERALRHAVEALRKAGIAIVALPSDGYFIARDQAEIDASISFLRKRALTSLVQIRQLKRLAVPDFAGQLRLRT